MGSLETGSTAAGVTIKEIKTAEIVSPTVSLPPGTIVNIFTQRVENLTADLRPSLDRMKAASDEDVSPEAKKSIESVIADYRKVRESGGLASPATLYRLGMLAAYEKDTEQAVGFFREAVRADPEYSEAYHALAWLQQMRAVREIEEMNLKTAAEMLREARFASSRVNDLGSLLQQGYNLKTMAQVEEGRGRGMTDEAIRYYDEAAGIFQEVLEQDPDNAGALNGLGNVRFARGETDEAISLAIRATELHPGYTAAFHDLGLYYLTKMEEDKGNARAWCRKARSALNRTFVMAKEDPGFCDEERGRLLEWIDTLDETCGEER